MKVLLDNNVITLDNELRVILSKIKDFDACFVNAVDYIRTKYGVKKGQIGLNLDVLIGYKFKEYQSYKKNSEFTIINFPRSNVNDKNHLSNFEVQLNAIQYNESNKPKSTLNEHTSKYSKCHTYRWDFFTNDCLIGFITIYAFTFLNNGIVEEIKHDVTVFFRRICEELNNKILRQLVQIKKFEEKANEIHTLKELQQNIVDSAILISGAQSATIIEMDIVNAKLKFVYLSEKWVKLSPDLLKKTLPLKNSIAGSSALCKISRIVANKNSENDYFSEHTMDRYITSMIQVPIVYQGITLGVISLESEEPDSFFLTDLMAIEILMGVAAPYLREYNRIQSENRVYDSFSEVFNGPERLNDHIDKFTQDLKLDFASIQLLKNDGGYIETVATSKTVPEAWAHSARHMLFENDIQSDMVKPEKGLRMEIIAGWDNRFDKLIYNRFGHEKLLRCWIPLVSTKKGFFNTELLKLRLAEDTKDVTIDKQNYSKSLNLNVETDNKEGHFSIGTIELGFFDKDKSKHYYSKSMLSKLIEFYNNLTQKILLHMPETAFKNLCEELVRASGATAVTINYGNLKGYNSFALSVGAINKTHNNGLDNLEKISDTIWDLASVFYSEPDQINISEKFKKPNILKNEYEVKTFSNNLWKVGIKSAVIYPLIRGILVIFYDLPKEFTAFELSIFDFGARSARRLIRHLTDAQNIDSRKRIISSLATLGEEFNLKKEKQTYYRELTKLLIRIFNAQVITIYETKGSDNVPEFVTDIYENSWYKENARAYEVNDIKCFCKNIKYIQTFNVSLSPGAKGFSRCVRLLLHLGIEPRLNITLHEPYIVIYLHYDRKIKNEKEVKDWLDKLIAPSIRRQLLIYDQSRQQESEIGAVRNLVSVDPSRGDKDVAQAGIDGLKSLSGYRGCGLFYLDSYHEQLIMEYFNNERKMLKENLPFPRRVTIRRYTPSSIFDSIVNDKGRVIAKVNTIGPEGLSQKTFKNFPWSDRIQLLIVNTWNEDSERDESLDLHQIVIAYDANRTLKKDEARFIANLCVHIRMAIKVAREWVRFEINRALEKSLPLASTLSAYCQSAAYAITSYIPGSSYLIYSTSYVDFGTQEEEFTLQGYFTSLDYTTAPPGNISAQNNPDLWNKIINKETVRLLSSQITKEINPWQSYIKEIISGVLLVPIKESLTRKVIGAILCLDTRSNIPNDIGYTPFHAMILENASEKIGIGISQKIREHEYFLATANLGHAVKAPLHGIIGYAEEADISLAINDHSAVSDHLQSIVELVKEADEQVLISVGKPAAEIVVSVGQMVKTIVDQYRILAKKRKISFNLHNSLFYIPPLKIKAPLLEIVISVLIDNAIKYSDPTRSVIIKGKRLMTGWRMEISNYGMGIKKEDYDEIYKPHTGSKDRLRGRYMRGSGLGLAVAKKICGELGINIYHESEFKQKGKPIGPSGYLTNFFLEFTEENFNKSPERRIYG